MHKLSLRRGATLLAFVLAACVCAAAQSSDLNFPTPLGTNEIEGRIAPRDLGDPRLTSHFYTFNGTQGDLAVTVESSNLDGAVDLFLLTGLRPLTQITLYASGSALNVTKTVFLRREVTLILRVQARPPNDAEGIYRLRLGGTFQPATNFAATPSQPETTAENRQPTRTPGKGVRRVNSVGARIDEPEAEVITPAETATDAKKSDTAAKEPTPTRAPTTRTRTPRRTRPAQRSETARRTTNTAEPNAETAKTGTGETAPADSSTAEPSNKPEAARPARTPARRTPRPSRAKETAKRPTSEPANETCTRRGCARRVRAADRRHAARHRTQRRHEGRTRNGQRQPRDRR